MDFNAITEEIRKFQSGDTEVFNDIYEGTYRLVYGECYGILRSEEDALDLTQDTYLSIYQTLDKLEEPGTYSKWMTTIARNKCLNYLQKHNRVSYTDNDMDLDLASDDWTEVDGLPDSFLEDEEKKTIINNILKDSLSEVQYQTIFMHYYNDMQVEDIAAEMGCPAGTVKTRLKSARDKFKEALEKYLSDNKIVLGAGVGTPFLTKFFTAQVNAMPIPSIPSFVPAVPAVTAAPVTTAVSSPAGNIAAAGVKNTANKAASHGIRGLASSTGGKVLIGGIGLIGGGAIIAGGVLLVNQLTKKQEVKIDLNEYIEYKVDGYNGEGKLSYSIDYDKINAAIPNSKEIKNADVSKMVSGSWDKDKALANGDEIRFTWVEQDGTDEFEEKAGVVLKHKDIVYVVEGLEEKPAVEINVFDYADLSVKVEGNDTVASVVLSPDCPVQDVTFKVTPDKGLLEGDTVTVTVEGEVSGYVFKETSKEFVVPAIEREVKVLDGEVLTVPGIFKVTIPVVEISGFDMTEVNNKISAEFDFFREMLDVDPSMANGVTPMSESFYSYDTVNGIMTITVVVPEYNWALWRGDYTYKFRISTQTGKLFTDDDMKELYGVDETEFRELVYNTVKKAMDDENKETDHASYFPKDPKKSWLGLDIYHQNLEDDVIGSAVPFLSDEGHLCFSISLYTDNNEMYWDLEFDTVTGMHRDEYNRKWRKNWGL